MFFVHVSNQLQIGADLVILDAGVLILVLHYNMFLHSLNKNPDLFTLHPVKYRDVICPPLFFHVHKTLRDFL